MHIGGGVGVGIHREAGLSVTQDTGQGLCVYAVGQGVGGESVP